MRPGYLTFALRETERSVEVNYSYPPDYPLYRTDGANDVYRACVDVGRDAVALVLQHLRLSDPPYTGAEAPGRAVEMTHEQFVQFVDAVVRLRDKVLR